MALARRRNQAWAGIGGVDDGRRARNASGENVSGGAQSPNLFQPDNNHVSSHRKDWTQRHLRGPDDVALTSINSLVDVKRL